MGVLTKYVSNQPKTFFSFDIDAASIAYTRQLLPDVKDAIIEKDFLEVDLAEFGNEVTIIGNFPYNISSQLLFKIYDNRSLVKEVVCMIQKEVADRVASQPGTRASCILTILLQAYYHVEFLFTVEPEAFQPPPRVKSAVIRLVRNNQKQLDCDEIEFKKIVKNAFGLRRKTLRNALKNLNLPPSILGDEMLGKRAEELSVSDFVELTNKLMGHGSSNKL